jgi:UDP-N-acetylglucosamine 2-epimerase (non-hydrolysing)/GDP/UDP-N,N'-diacetylbacillosamine 2-epimerase (hydrolysing)
MPRRKIAVFTGNRSEYGLQFPILRAIAADPRLQYFLLAGGAHLEQDFGNTLAEIREDGFEVYREVRIETTHGSAAYTAQCIGMGILSVSTILDELRPDFLLVYGDRFESLAALIAATQMNIPVAHVEGGDYTEGGALDDSVRHAMTKLAHLHFATNPQSAERVRGLGEEPWRILTVGLPSLDLAASGYYTNPEALASEFCLDSSRPIILFCQHSVATEADEVGLQIAPALAALRRLLEEGYQVIATYPNDDAGGRTIIRELERLQAEGHPGLRLVRSLGRHRFHGMLNMIGRLGRGAIVGNSSAAIKEAGAFACAAVNIGSRQRGRLRGANVLDVPYEAEAVLNAVRRCTYDEDFRGLCRNSKSPYGAGDAGRRIAESLATITIDRRLLQKRMTY